jgi:hypothetical protein
LGRGVAHFGGGQYGYHQHAGHFGRFRNGYGGYYPGFYDNYYYGSPYCYDYYGYYPSYPWPLSCS